MGRARRLPVAIYLLLLVWIAPACGATPVRSAPTGTRSTSSVGPTAVTSTMPTPSGTPTPEPAERWRPLPRAPIEGRIAAGAVWTGDEMIVWGGLARTRRIAPLADGAAYDPSSDSWRPLAPAPEGVLGIVDTAAAWTGRVALFWAGNSPDRPATGATYDPRRDAWTRLPDGPLGPREAYVSAWTGRELLIVGGTYGDTVASPVAAAVDPQTLTWRSLPALDALRAFIPSGGVWADDRLFVAGGRYLCRVAASTCTRIRHLFVAYDPSSDTLDRIDMSTAPLPPRVSTALAPIGWTGTEIALRQLDHPSAPLVLFDPSNGSWRVGATPPRCATDEDLYAQQAWIGDRYVVACGKESVEVYDVARDRWRMVAAGASPFNARAWSAICWTGSELIVWSGTPAKRGNPTPATGAALVLGR